MIHSFDVDVATKYGIEIAILLNQINYWCLKNEANGKHLHNGKFWVYNTKKAFTKMFPYMSERQINYTLTKMKNENLILTDNFNYSKMDRTTWYTLTDFAKCILQNCKMENTNLRNAIDKIVDCNLQNCQMEETKLSNGNYKNVKCIDNINNINISNTNKYTNKYTNKERTKQERKTESSFYTEER